jgi:MFS family permease
MGTELAGGVDGPDQAPGAAAGVGDLFGRKRAFVLGLLGYAVGAVAMTLGQSLTAIIVCWAIVGGLGASLCCRRCSR